MLLLWKWAIIPLRILKVEFKRYIQEIYRKCFSKYRIIMNNMECHVRIGITHLAWGYASFKTQSSLEPLRLRLRGPNITLLCKTQHNPTLVVCYSLNNTKHLACIQGHFIFNCWFGYIWNSKLHLYSWRYGIIFLMQRNVCVWYIGTKWHSSLLIHPILILKYIVFAHVYHK